MKQDWTALLQQAGIPETPGYQQLLKEMQQKRAIYVEQGWDTISRRSALSIQAKAKRRAARKPKRN
jgi:hypothetical protein